MDFAQLRAVYAFERSLTDPADTRNLLTRAADSGLTTLITKATAVTPWLREACHAAGLTVAGSVGCFSDHALPPAQRRDDLRPVGADGTWATMEWYTGIIPTDAGYNDDLIHRCATIARNGLLDGIVLDFLRWPLHWELELRPDATPRAASFDPTTLAVFRQRTGHDVPTEPRAAAALLLGPLAADWYAYRADTITELAARIATQLRAAAPGLPIGMFVVPEVYARRRELVGQDVTALGSHVDGFLAMTYHRIAGQTVGWVDHIVADLRAHTARPVAIMVQTTSDPAVAGGADWGTAVTAAEFGGVLRRAGSPVCLFPADGMDDARWRLLPSALRKEL